MKIVSRVREMQMTADELRRDGRRISIVPTMGSLHEGHLSLMRIARLHGDVVVTTIFVNPTQFAPNEDFAKYPRNLDRDTQLAASAGTDILFTPAAEEIYPHEYSTYVEVERITRVLEGQFRATHFRGVTTIVAKLFNILKPHAAVFGQKDAQQVAVVRRMVHDLNFDLDVVVGPIIREPDGLAMSSRNVYLSESERKQSTALYRSLQHAERCIKNGERSSLRVLSEMKELIMAQPSARVEYVSIADPSSLEEIATISPDRSILVSLAVCFGATRLIDNMLVSRP